MHTVRNAGANLRNGWAITIDASLHILHAIDAAASNNTDIGRIDGGHSWAHHPGRHIRSSVMQLAMKPTKRVSAPSLVPAKPKALPRPGQRTYLGCAYLYIEQALAELSPSGRREVAKDLRAYIDLLVCETSDVDDEP
jgi:hypothetical protein